MYLHQLALLFFGLSVVSPGFYFIIAGSTYVCRGQRMTPDKAELQYLHKVKWLDLYGVDMHFVMVGAT